jgi:diacylglycerol kinase (ATP)
MSRAIAERELRPPVDRKLAKVAVLAHRKKSLDGGLDELRNLLTGAGYDNLLWYEVPKSKKAPQKARKALEEGAELAFVWGGDGMVQRCVDAFAGSAVAVAIIPAGTANLLAGNLGIPRNVAQAVEIGLYGGRRRLDLGRLNGEHFAVMAGAGFDAELIGDASRGLKQRAGRLAYLWTGLKHVTGGVVTTTVIRVDGTRWFVGDASCVLLGNCGTMTGGVTVFDDARPDDGWLEVGVATAQGALQWLRTMGRVAAGRSESSPFVRITRAKKIDVRFSQPMPYELDGGERGTTTRLKARVAPAAVTICVPAPQRT